MPGVWMPSIGTALIATVLKIAPSLPGREKGSHPAMPRSPPPRWSDPKAGEGPVPTCRLCLRNHSPIQRIEENKAGLRSVERKRAERCVHSTAQQLNQIHKTCRIRGAPHATSGSCWPGSCGHRTRLPSRRIAFAWAQISRKRRPGSVWTRSARNSSTRPNHMSP
jgi:hypothetical protein